MTKKLPKKYHKEIAPRLVNGNSRLNVSLNLPPDIKEALRYVAFKDRKSVSWLLEFVIIQYFEFDEPEYKERKKKK
jgi:hypothetical protein